MCNGTLALLTTQKQLAAPPHIRAQVPVVPILPRRRHRFRKVRFVLRAERAPTRARSGRLRTCCPGVRRRQEALALSRTHHRFLLLQKPGERWGIGFVVIDFPKGRARAQIAAWTEQCAEGCRGQIVGTR